MDDEYGRVWGEMDDAIRLIVLGFCRTLPPCDVPPRWASMTSIQQGEVVRASALLFKVGLHCGVLAKPRLADGTYL